MVSKFTVENENTIQETLDGDIQWGSKHSYEKKYTGMYDTQRKVNTNQWISISLLFNEVFKQQLINCGINQNL